MHSFDIMDTSVELAWTDNMLKILTKEQPKLRASALRMLFILETYKFFHRFGSNFLFKTFNSKWTDMQESMETMLLNLDANRSFIKEDIIHHAEEDLESFFVREKQILKSSVFRVWNALKYHRSPPIWVKDESNTFMEMWIDMEGFLNDIISSNLKDMHFCCELKCVFLPNKGVDGQACQKCRSFGNCHCDCVMYMKYMNDKHCCELFCTKPELGICLLCPGACLCKCVLHQYAMLRKYGIETWSINGQMMELVKYQEETYCCEKKCFPTPYRLYRGLVCNRCDAVNFCKCKCVTWKNRSSRYECLKKPTGGWQDASEKDLVEYQEGKSFKDRLRDHYFSTII